MHVVACELFIILEVTLFVRIATAAGCIQSAPLRWWMAAQAFALTLTYSCVVASYYALYLDRQLRERHARGESSSPDSRTPSSMRSGRS